ncbi:hypothetical protein M9H77_06484 [Catharanthus roseus]|uniref:Uncharacterized protein n=1 Tax=Catharanthus roseus TaxID=4058 RepID=A0ACC0BSE9_CATRO|nr:hypothetical protein M9H77_06484 [Catharanthus roseus]
MGQISKEHPIFLVYAPSEVPNRNVEKEDENDKETKTQSQSPQFEANQSEPNSSIGSSGKYLLTTSTGTPKEMDPNFSFMETSKISIKPSKRKRLQLKSLTSKIFQHYVCNDLLILDLTVLLLSISPFAMRVSIG